MRLISVLVLIAVFAAFSFAQSPNLYSDADAVFAEIHKTYVLNPDGSSQYFYAHKVKPLTYYAVNRYLGETFIVYNPDLQRLIIDKSETTMADGTVVQSPANAYNEVLPGAVANAPAYAHLREMVVTHTGLERNCQVDLQYHIDTDSSFFPWLMGEELFGSSSPIQKMTVTVRIPNNAILHFRFFNATVEPVVTKSGQYTDYVWTMNDLPMLRSEANHQAFGEFTPRLIFSTCPDWGALLGYVGKGLTDKFLLSEKSKATLLSTITDSTELARALAIRKIVADQIGTVNINPSLLGYRISSAEEVFHRNYGHALDKAVLLATLFKVQGACADVLLTSATNQFEESVPSLRQFNGAVVRLKQTDDSAIFLLPTGTQDRPAEYDLAGKTLLDLSGSEPNLIEMPAISADENVLSLQASLTVDTTWVAKGTIRLEAKGALLPSYELTDTESKRAFVQKAVSQIFGKNDKGKITVDSVRMEGDVFLAEMKADGLFEEVGNQKLFEFGGLSSVLDEWHISAAPTKRFTPLQLPAPITEHITVTFNFPDSFAVAGEMKDVVMENEMGRLSLTWQVDGNQLVVSHEFVLRNPVVLTLEYPEFREVIGNLQRNRGGSVFITHKDTR